VRLDLLVDPDRVTHAIPEGDLFLHREGTDCPCQPLLKIDQGQGVIVHRAWDGRTSYDNWNVIEGES